MLENIPSKVFLGDITLRDGFQHEEKFISTDAKLYYAEQLILAGIRRLELTNLGNPKRMPQFKDGHELLKKIRSSKKIINAGIDWKDVEITAVTIREKAVDSAIEAKKEGYGPDRILMMVSTDEEHHYANSGLTLPEYWKEAERCIQKAHDAGLKVNGTVSTIWGSPISGPTELDEAVKFAKYWLQIGADDIEHADHDGSATPNEVYKYFIKILDAIPNPMLHIAHFHTTRGFGMANIIAALSAGICCFESTLGGIGGQPSNFIDDTPVEGTGEYYYIDPRIVGLVCTEDIALMMSEMGIETGLDIAKILLLGRKLEKTLNKRLRSEAIYSGPILREANNAYKREGLKDRKIRANECVDQKFPIKY